MGRWTLRDGLFVLWPAGAILAVMLIFAVGADFVGQFRSSSTFLDLTSSDFRELSLRQQAIQQRATLYTLMGGAAAGLIGLYFLLWRTQIAEQQKQIAAEHKKLADKQRATDLIAKAAEMLGSLRDNGETKSQTKSENAKERPGKREEASSSSSVHDEASGFTKLSSERGLDKESQTTSTETTRKLYQVIEENRRAAILLLERVGRESEELTNDIKNLLAAYVRSESEFVRSSLKPTEKDSDQSAGDGEYERRRRLMRAAIRSIAKLEKERARKPGRLTSLRSIDLAGEKLWEISFQNCDLSNANFTDCEILDGNFDGADLTNAVFFKTRISAADFRSAKNLTPSQLNKMINTGGIILLPDDLEPFREMISPAE